MLNNIFISFSLKINFIGRLAQHGIDGQLRVWGKKSAMWEIAPQ